MNKSKRDYYLFGITLILICILFNVLVKFKMCDGEIGINIFELCNVGNDYYQLLFVALYRFKILFVIYLFGLFIDWSLVKNISLIIAGICFGYFFSSIGYYCKISDYFLFMIYILPQMILYYLSALMLCNGNLYEKSEIRIKKYMSGIVLFVSGVLCECFFSKKLLCFFINILLQK